MKIIVGMSGGVDSSVTALMLKEQGHEVIGVTMAIWDDDKSPAVKNDGHGKNSCYGADEKEDIEIATKICKEIGIDYHVFDCVEEYEKVVLENFREEYLEGRTPNPCVRCNSLMKFDVLPHMAKQAGIEFDYFATGHYASCDFDETRNRYVLKKGTSQKKDQSYFLYRLKQEQLAKTYLPLGKFTKDEVRQYAREHGLSVADKKDSQDFYSGNYNELLKVKEMPGNVVDEQGNILGHHTGIWNFTIGQRKGLGIAHEKPLYVVGLRKNTNEVVVGSESATLRKFITVRNVNWISQDGISGVTPAKAKYRSFQNEIEVLLSPETDGRVKVEFLDLQKSVSPGQSIVFYDGDLVLGGGVIETVDKNGI